MKKVLFVSFILMHFMPACFAQKITNMILVGDMGVTKNVHEAHSFILIKQLPDLRFERSEYKLRGPIRKLRTYSDTALTILHGRYLEYTPEGNLRIWGAYSNNKKSETWYVYNDTGKVVLEQKYLNDELIESVNPDTVEEKELVEYPDDREASFKGKDGAWGKYLSKRLSKSDVTEKSLKGGKVMVSFAIDTNGKVFNVFLRKSVEFVLDEEAISVIQDSPNWIPAFQNGRHVKAYRNQPLTFVKHDL